MKYLIFVAILVSSLTSSERVYHWSLGSSMELSSFKSSLNSRTGIFDSITVSKSSQTKRSHSLELKSWREIVFEREAYSIGGFITLNNWSNANSRSFGGLLHKKFSETTLFQKNMDLLGSFKLGKIDFQVDDFSSDSSYIFAIEGVSSFLLENRRTNISLGYNFTDIESTKKYAIGGIAKHSIKYKGGIYLNFSLVGLF